MNPTAFSDLNLKIHMLKNLASLGYTTMTPIQAHSLPPILAGKDVIAKAKTGSGKTAAFGIGLLTHLEAGRSQVQALVLCPTPGFQEEIGALVAATPGKRQTLLFSATYPDAIAAMSADIQREPVEVSVDETHDAGVIEQVFYEVTDGERTEAVARILGHYRPESTLVFCNTRMECQELADALVERGFAALAIHGDLEQRERDQVLVRFANKSASVLVATDVAARGLDIKELAAVVNYELSRDPEIHIHRIGRTGRAGERGLAVSLVTAQKDRRARSIEEAPGSSITRGEVGSLKASAGRPPAPPMVTLCITGGRRNKLRPADVLGALTGEGGVGGGEVGKIDVFDAITYVAIVRARADQALACLGRNKIKGRFFKVKKIG